MMPATNLIFWSGIAAFSLAVLIIFWALLFDRLQRIGKPRIKRCPRCWYVMENIEHLTCPECGHTVRRERRLYLSRRRWRWVVVGMFLAVIGAAGSFYPRLNTLTWIPHTPSWILINLIQDVGPTPDTVWRISYPAGRNWGSPSTLPTISQQIADELWMRYADGRLPLWERRAMTARKFKTFPPLTVSTRKQWPADLELMAVLNGNFSGPFPRNLRVHPQFAGSIDAVASDDGWTRYDSLISQASGHWLQSLGLPPSGTKQIVLVITVTEGDDVIWSGTNVVQVQVSGGVDEILKPQSSPELDQLVRQSIVTPLTVNDHEGWIVVRTPQTPLPQDMTFALRMEVRHGSEVVANAQVLWTNFSSPIPDSWGGPGTVQRSEEYWCPIRGDLKRLEAASPGDGTWTIRVIGDGAAALSDFQTAAYWSGEIEIPLRPK